MTSMCQCSKVLNGVVGEKLDRRFGQKKKEKKEKNDFCHKTF